MSTDQLNGDLAAREIKTKQGVLNEVDIDPWEQGFKLASQKAVLWKPCLLTV